VSAGPGELPLWGARVLVTAPRQYAARLAGRLIDAGARPVLLPAVRVGRLRTPAALAGAPAHDTRRCY